MNIQGRVQHYVRGGFGSHSAAVNALLEEALGFLFGRYPAAFVFFGGASLVLFYESPRLSADLDLLVLLDRLPTPEELVETLVPLSESATALGYSRLAVRAVLAGEGHLKLAVQEDQQVLFTIDLSRVTAVIQSAIVEAQIVHSRSEQVKAQILSRDFLLFQKAESFLLRRHVKVRDAFDIKFLMDQGAELTRNLRAHLSDGRASEILEDVDQINAKIALVSAARCRSELQPVLPVRIYQELEASGFEGLRVALRKLFQSWIEEA